MKNLALMVTLVLAALSGCKCGTKTEAPGPDAAVTASAEVDAGAPPAAVEAPVTPAVQKMRESDLAFQQGKPDEAIEKAKAVVAEQPKNAIAHNIIGRSYAAKFAESKNAKDADAGREAFQKAIEADPRFWPAMLNLAELEEKAGRKKEAAAQYAKVLELEPNHPSKADFEARIAEAKKAK